MFERFTERARRVVVLAQEEASTLGHNYIGTEHILLGLVRENEGVAARILLDLGADCQKIRNEVIRMLSGPAGGRTDPGTSSPSPATPRTAADAPHAADTGSPHLGNLSDDALRDLISQLADRERSVSYERRILHGKIDILRAELANRRRPPHTDDHG